MAEVQAFRELGRHLVAVGPAEVDARALLEAFRRFRRAHCALPQPRVAKLSLAAWEFHIHLVDGRSGVFECAHRLGGDPGDLALDWEATEVRAPGDAQAFDAAPRRGSVIRRIGGQAVRVAVLRAGDRVEHQHRVGDRPRQRPRVREGHREHERVRPRDRRHPAERRLEPEHAAPSRGDADRAASIRPLCDRRKPCRDRSCASAGRAARVLADVEWRARWPKQVVVGDALVAELRCVRLAEHDRARALEALDVGGADVGHIVLERLAAERVGHARLHVEKVLDRNRKSEQGWMLLLAAQSLLRGTRLLPGFVSEHEHVRVDRRDEAVNRPRGEAKAGREHCGEREAGGGLLDGKIVEVIGAGYTQRADQCREQQIAFGELEKWPPMSNQQPCQQDQHGKRGAGLGNHQGRDCRTSGKQAF